MNGDITTTKWRTDNWKKNPCDNCSRKEIDQYGLVCDLTCGEGTAHNNFEAGADAILKALREGGRSTRNYMLLQRMDKIDCTNYHPDSEFEISPNGIGKWVFIPDDEIVTEWEKPPKSTSAEITKVSGGEDLFY